jgi:hypothetical protein
MALVTLLIVVHGLVPKRFAVDSTTVGLLGVLLVVILVPLLDSAKLPGGTELNFRHQLDRLQAESTAAVADQSDQPAVPPSPAPVTGSTEVRPPITVSTAGHMPSSRANTDDRSADQIVGEILVEAARSPRVGLLIMTAELERAVRVLLLSTGWGTWRTTRSLREGVARLVEVGVLTLSAASALNLFTSVRNEIVHGGAAASDAEILRALDATIPLLRAVLAIPRERHIVALTDVLLYSSPQPDAAIADARGLILESLSPGIRAVTSRIFPVTSNHYVVGQEVTWEWGSRSWPKTWYRNPESGEIDVAWDGSAEFIGRGLSDV